MKDVYCIDLVEEHTFYILLKPANHQFNMFRAKVLVDLTYLRKRQGDYDATIHSAS